MKIPFQSLWIRIQTRASNFIDDASKWEPYLPWKVKITNGEIFHIGDMDLRITTKN